jgi:hypothetical protein
MDEISRIGDINSVNNFLDFKLSIKTIIFLVFGWGFACLVIIVFMLGGINNTVDYVANILDTIKTTVIDTKNRNTTAHIEKTIDKTPDKNTDKNND